MSDDFNSLDGERRVKALMTVLKQGLVPNDFDELVLSCKNTGHVSRLLVTAMKKTPWRPSSFQVRHALCTPVATVPQRKRTSRDPVDVRRT